MTQMQRLLFRLSRIYVPDDNVRAVLTVICINAVPAKDGRFLPVCYIPSDELFDSLISACARLDDFEIERALDWLESHDIITVENPTDDNREVWINWYKFDLLSSGWETSMASEV